MIDCNEKSKRSEEDYKTHFYNKRKQELLNHLPEWLKVLRDFYLKYRTKA
jgi:hypothetical protein